MGQERLAVAFGVIKTKKLDKAINARLMYKDGKYLDGWKDTCPNEPNVYNGMGDSSALGFLVAIDGDNQDRPGVASEVPDLPLDAKAARRLLGAARVRMAEKKWAKFSEWAAELGVVMPEPMLIVTKQETA